MSRSIRDRARAMAKRHLRFHLRRLLGAGPDEPVYPRIVWLKARLRGIVDRQPIYRGVRVEWDSPMHGWCVPFDLAGPGRGRVLVRTILSAMSPGTELATFSARPNTGAAFPTFPGYSGIGEIIRVGRGVRGLSPGQIVAGQAGHASLAVLRAEEVFAVPEGVSPEAAAIIHIGIIAYHGVRRAQLGGGERVAVFGRGVIGQLAGQIARAQGAAEVISVARSNRHVGAGLLRRVDRVLSTAQEGQRALLRDLAVDLAIEATGDPAALHDALAATRDGGRVVLLGSSRGITKAFDFGSLADRNVALVGANIRTLMRAPDGGYHRAGETFLQLVAEGRIDPAGLVDLEINPWEAGWFYRHLADGSLASVAPILRWACVEPASRLQRVRFWTPPDTEAIRARTMRRATLGAAGRP